MSDSSIHGDMLGARSPSILGHSAGDGWGGVGNRLPMSCPWDFYPNNEHPWAVRHETTLHRCEGRGDCGVGVWRHVCEGLHSQKTPRCTVMMCWISVLVVDPVIATRLLVGWMRSCRVWRVFDSNQRHLGIIRLLSTLCPHTVHTPLWKIEIKNNQGRSAEHRLKNTSHAGIAKLGEVGVTSYTTELARLTLTRTSLEKKTDRTKKICDRTKKQPIGSRHKSGSLDWRWNNSYDSSCDSWESFHGKGHVWKVECCGSQWSACEADGNQADVCKTKAGGCVERNVKLLHHILSFTRWRFVVRWIAHRHSLDGKFSDCWRPVVRVGIDGPKVWLLNDV